MIPTKFSFIAGAAALAATSLAGESEKPPLQRLHNSINVQPARAAAYTIVDGRIALTSDWAALGGPAPRTSYVAAFDAIELEMNGNIFGPPTDQPNPPGPTGCLASSLPNHSRWFFGPAYTNPFFASDLTPSAAGAGVLCRAVAFLWYVDPGIPEPEDETLYVAIHQYEQMDVTGCSDPGSKLIDGVLYEFRDPPRDPAYYNRTVVFNSPGIGHTMPVASGGYHFTFAVAFDEESGKLTLPRPGSMTVQPMLWGTGGNEFGAPDDGRPGVDVDGGFDGLSFDDDHEPEYECNSYLYGVCPDPLAPAVGFYYSTSVPCACTGDVDDDGQVAMNDLAMLLAHFGSECPCAVPCVDVNADNSVNISDLALVLGHLGSTCP